MASQRILAKQSAAREKLARRIDEISQPDFIKRYIYGSLPEYCGGGGRPEECRILVVQNDGTGAATVEYETEDSIKVFAKLYMDDSGEHSYRVLRTLWNDGFGASSRYRVSEPLGFFPEYNMLLTRSADGSLVASAKSDAELAAGAREAAHWLVQLHSSTVRVGETCYPWDVYRKLARRLAKASARHPNQVDEMIEMVDRFEELTRGVKLRFVQAHGQYRHIHVFVSDGGVTVIDLDRSRPSDPAKDLGEFIHRMRTQRFKASAGLSRAEEATRAFLEEYGAKLPENLVNLPFYWCYHALISLWHFMRGSTPADAHWELMTGFYLSEFERASSHHQMG